MRNSAISSAASIWVIRRDFYVHLPVASVHVWKRISGEHSRQYVIYFSLEFGWQFLCGNSVDVLTDEDDDDSSTFEWFFNVLLCVQEIEIHQYASAKARIFDTFPNETKSMQILVSEVQAGCRQHDKRMAVTNHQQDLIPLSSQQAKVLPAWFTLDENEWNNDASFPSFFPIPAVKWYGLQMEVRCQICTLFLFQFTQFLCVLEKRRYFWQFAPIHWPLLPSTFTASCHK